MILKLKLTELFMRLKAFPHISVNSTANFKE